MKKIDLLIIIALFVISVVTLRDLFKPGFYTSHDGGHQVARLYYFDQAIKDGQFPPRWAGGLQNGFGYPLFVFSYQMPWMIAEPLHLSGLSIFDSIKMTFFLGFFLSGVSMYFFQKELFGRLPAVVGTLIYLFAPYRFSNIFVRGAIGDATTFIFSPLLFLSLYKIRQHKHFCWKWVSLASVSISGLLLSHAMIFLFYAIALILYFIYFFFSERNKKLYIISFCVITLLSIGLSGYYLIPSYIERNMTNFSSEMKPIFLNTKFFLNAKELLYTPWGYGLLDAPVGRMSFQLGIAQWVVVAGTVVILTKFLVFDKRRSLEKIQVYEIFYYVLLFIISLVLTLEMSMFFWKAIMDIAIIDFSWRMLVLSVFSVSVMAGFLIKHSRFRIGIILCICILALYANRNHTRVNKISDWPLDLYLLTEFTTNTYNEYRPKWVWPNFIEKKLPKVQFTRSASIDIRKNTSNRLSFIVNAQESGSAIINTIYYPGWKVKVNGIDIGISSNKVGLMEMSLPKGISNVEAQFTETPVRLISNYLTLSTIGIIIIGFLLRKKYA